VSNTLDLTSAVAGSFTPGSGTSFLEDGAAGGAQAFNTYNNAPAASNPGANVGWIRMGGVGGAGGASTAGAGSPGGSNTRTPAQPQLASSVLLYGGLQLAGGAGGGNGRGGWPAAYSTSSGTRWTLSSSVGGGKGGGCVAVYARSIVKGAATPSNVFRAIGGDGSIGAPASQYEETTGSYTYNVASPTSGGGGGGGGGFVFLGYNALSGPTVSNLIVANGGNGGRGGLGGTFTSSVGNTTYAASSNGSGGGPGGILAMDLGNNQLVAWNTGSAASGSNGGICVLSL
jgi:hypothetical protein